MHCSKALAPLQTVNDNDCYNYKMTKTINYSLFFLNDVLQSGKHLVLGKGSKPKPRTTWLKCRNDLWQVVTNYAESRVFGKFLNYWNQNRAHNIMTASLNVIKCHYNCRSTDRKFWSISSLAAKLGVKCCFRYFKITSKHQNNNKNTTKNNLKYHHLYARHSEHRSSLHLLHPVLQV